MSLSLALSTVAGLACLIAWIWLIVVAFQTGQKTWGIVLIVSGFIPLVGPILALVFIIKQWAVARVPGMVYVGSVMLAIVSALLVLNDVRRATRELMESPDLQAALQRAQEDGQAPGIPNETDDPPMPPIVDPPPVAPPATPPPARRTTPRPLPTPDFSQSPMTPSASPPATPPSLPPEEAPKPDSRKSPLTVDMIQLGDPNPNQMRTVHARVRNTARQPIREARLTLNYFDGRGLRIGRWTTVHSDSTDLVPAQATNTLTFQAFFVPQFTRSVGIKVESVRFANGERWPSIDPTLARPAGAP